MSRVKDDAARPRVKEMMQRIRNSAGGAAVKAKAEEAFKKYEATFSGIVAVSAAKIGGVRRRLRGKNKPGALFAAVARALKPESRRLRGKSFLFTYNWDFFGRKLRDGTASPAGAGELWQLWRAWKKDAKERYGVERSSSTLEQSLDSVLEGRVHLHWKVDLKQPIDQLLGESFRFHGIRPDVRKTFGETIAQKQGARGVSFEEASNRGHFYCVVQKEGTLHTGTNWHAFKDYRVSGRWIEDLWGDAKLSHDTYRDLSVRVRKGHAQRMRDLQAVSEAEGEARIDAHIRKVNRSLSKLVAPYKTFPQVIAWEDSFLEVRFRWKVLALCADSAAGKSNFAESLFENPYCLTVEDSDHLDLKNFDRDKHDGIVLDNVNSWGQLLSWRAVLQARNAKFKGGTSATNMYAWSKYLYGVPFVATVDFDAPDAYIVDETSQWQSTWLMKNTERVFLSQGETFYDQAKLPKRKLRNCFSLFAATLKKRRS